MQDQMGINFLELKQGNGTVEEYEAKFTELARLVLVSKTERQRGFYQGLKAWIKGKPSILELELDTKSLTRIWRALHLTKVTQTKYEILTTSPYLDKCHIMYLYIISS